MKNKILIILLISIALGVFFKSVEGQASLTNSVIFQSSGWRYNNTLTRYTIPGQFPIKRTKQRLHESLVLFPRVAAREIVADEQQPGADLREDAVGVFTAKARGERQVVGYRVTAGADQRPFIADNREALRLGE